MFLLYTATTLLSFVFEITLYGGITEIVLSVSIITFGLDDYGHLLMFVNHPSFEVMLDVKGEVGLK